MTQPVPELLDALDALRRGEAIIYPTETLYGIGADATDADAVTRVARLKGRDSSKPILVLVASIVMLRELVLEVPESAQLLIDHFWPGPLTIVLRARSGLPTELTGGRDTIGVRCSSNPIAQALVEQLGRPLTSTSANPGGASPAADIETARRYFSGRIGVFVAAGEILGGVGSTVVDLSGRKAVLVREGVVSAATIERAGVKLTQTRT